MPYPWPVLDRSTVNYRYRVPADDAQEGLGHVEDMRGIAINSGRPGNLELSVKASDYPGRIGCSDLTFGSGVATGDYPDEEALAI